VGADIDLGVWSGRFYGKRDTRRMGDHSETKRTISPVFFNNLVVAAGVEKQWNKCALQLVPFVSLPVRDVDYKSSKPMVGISLGVLLGRSCD
jgi:hypothetical protein